MVAGAIGGTINITTKNFDEKKGKILNLSNGYNETKSFSFQNQKSLIILFVPQNSIL